MTSTRAKVSATLASVGVLAAGWGVATAEGRALPVPAGPAPASPAVNGSAAVPAAPATGRSTTTSGAAAAASYRDGTYTGATATHRFGSVTVTAVVSGGRISSLSERVVSDGHGKSNQINARSVPTIRSKVLAANSAQVSTISGATYTTEAYLTSLQSALDQAS